MSDTLQHDQIHRFTLADDQLRGELVTLANSYREAVERQDLPEPIARLLGEFFAASVLLAEVLKFTGTLTLQVRGDGVVPLIMAEATSERTVRGIAKLAQNRDMAGLAGMGFDQLVGKGVLTLTIDPHQGRRYQGIVPVDAADLADCLSHYFAQSEQLPTRIWLSAADGVAAGMLLQQLPVSRPAESTAGLWQTVAQLASTQTHEELKSLPHASVLYRLFHEVQVKLFPPHPVRFACSCSAERSANALLAVGRSEALDIIAERGAIDMDCQFCGAHYRFEEREVRSLFGDNATEH